MEIGRVPAQLVNTEILLADERSGVYSAYRRGYSKRTNVVGWLMQLAIDVKASTDVYLRSVQILDACLERENVTEDLRLVACVSLDLASIFDKPGDKDTGFYRRWFDISAYDALLVEVFKVLGCSVSMPTDKTFLDIIFTYTKAEPEARQLANLYSTVMTLYEPRYLPSVRATACAYLAQRIYNGPKVVNVFGVPPDVVKHCVSNIVSNVDSLNTIGKGVYKSLPDWSDKFLYASVFSVNVKQTPENAPNHLLSTYYKPSLRIVLIPPPEMKAWAKIGKGASGSVRRVEYEGATYAVKHFSDPDDFMSTFVVREISIMQSLSDDNVVKICHITSDLTSIFLELGEGDMRQWIDKNGPLNASQQNDFAVQVLDALTYIHSCGVLHRDIKPQNIIVYTNNGEHIYKITDFGLGRGCDIALDTGIYTTNVCTLFYRPLELLLGSEVYGDRLDLWSMLCTLYEVATEIVLFWGGSEIEQIVKIFRVLGVPTEETWPGVSRLPETGPLKLNIVPDSRPLSHEKLCPEYKVLLQYGLVMDPNQRPSALQLQDRLLEMYEEK